MTAAAPYTNGVNFAELEGRVLALEGTSVRSRTKLEQIDGKCDALITDMRCAELERIRINESLRLVAQQVGVDPEKLRRYDFDDEDSVVTRVDKLQKQIKDVRRKQRGRTGKEWGALLAKVAGGIVIIGGSLKQLVELLSQVVGR